MITFYLTDESLFLKYKNSARRFCDFLDCDRGQVNGFWPVFNRFKKLEFAFARRGYRTIPLADFVCLKDDDVSLSFSTQSKRNYNEEPVLYAERYIAD